MTSGAAVLDAVSLSLRRLYSRDADLFDVDATERAVTHRLATYLERNVARWHERWHVDCEYNRYGEARKVLDFLVPHMGVPSVDDTRARTVYPDIIVHRRREPEANLLVIEAKKEWGDTDEIDAAKISAFTDPDQGFHYRWGIVLRLGADACTSAEVYRDGAVSAPWTNQLHTRLRARGVLE